MGVFSRMGPVEVKLIIIIKMSVLARIEEAYEHFSLKSVVARSSCFVLCCCLKCDC